MKYCWQSRFFFKNFQKFSENNYIENTKEKVKDLCDQLREDVEVLDAKLSEAEQNNEKFKYKLIEEEGIQLLKTLESNDLYLKYNEDILNSEEYKETFTPQNDTKKNCKNEF